MRREVIEFQVSRDVKTLPLAIHSSGRTNSNHDHKKERLGSC